MNRQLWRWALAVFAVAVAIHLPYLAPGGPWARRSIPLVLGQDEGTVLADAYRITRGAVMYRDFFEFQGPVFYYLYAGLFAITGPSLAAARVLQIVTAGAGTALLFVLVARFAGRLGGLGSAAVHAALLVPQWPFTYPHWLAEALAFGALVLLTGPGPRRARDEWGAGALLGAAALTIQSVGVPVLGAVALALAIPGLARRSLRESLLAPARLVGGAALVIGVILVWFAAHGALGALLYAMFRWPREHYAHENQVGYGWWTTEAIADHARVAQPWRAFATIGLRVTWVCPLVALGGALVVAGRVARACLFPPPGEDPGRFDDALVAAAALAAVLPLFLLPVRPDLVHVAYLGGFGLAGGAAAIGVLSRVAWRRIASANLAFAGAIALASFGAKTALTWHASRTLGSWRAQVLTLPDARRIDALPPSSTIVVGAMGGFYYLLLRPPATAFTFLPGSDEHYLADVQWQRAAGEIVAKRPAALDLVGIQWQVLVRHRPELARIYRDDHGLLVLVGGGAP